VKGLTHVLFGAGFVSLVLVFFNTPLIFWVIGTFFISPIFSRLPDKDQKIARITFNQIIPHRGRTTHNLLYGLPLLALFSLTNLPVVGSLFVLIIGSIFGALFAHACADVVNYAGVWAGFFRVKGFLRWDSIWGNYALKLIGIVLIIISIISFL
jgi:membrane-bound metal-dependent hydrolase YbcI (DUF457 family)